MWKPDKEGVYLQRVETNEGHKIIIKLVRALTDNVDSLKQLEHSGKVISMSLHIAFDGAEKYKLDFDPWSDINVIADGSIDEKDVSAITEVGLSFYRQQVISPEYGVFLVLNDVDLVEVFDPAKSIEPVTPLRHAVRIEALDLDDTEEPELDASFYATSNDEGATFAVRKINAHTYNLIETPGLSDLVRAFFKLKL